MQTVPWGVILLAAMEFIMTTQGACSLVHQGYKYTLYRITAPVFATKEEFFQCFQDTWIDGNFPSIPYIAFSRSECKQL